MSVRPAVPPRPSFAGRRIGGRRGVVAGVVAGVAAVAALGGCSLIPGLGGAGGGAGSSATDGAGGATWHYYDQGQQVESTTPEVIWPAKTSRSPLSLPSDDPNRLGSSPGPVCVDWLEQGQINGLTVDVGTTPGQVTVRWPNTVDPRLISYRLATTPQQLPGGSHPPYDWRDVEPAPDCQEMTATITGLTSGLRYVFWLDAVVTTAYRGVREPMIARSEAITAP